MPRPPLLYLELPTTALVKNKIGGLLDGSPWRGGLCLEASIEGGDLEPEVQEMLDFFQVSFFCLPLSNILG